MLTTTKKLIPKVELNLPKWPDGHLRLSADFDGLFKDNQMFPQFWLAEIPSIEDTDLFWAAARREQLVQVGDFKLDGKRYVMLARNAFVRNHNDYANRD